MSYRNRRLAGLLPLLLIMRPIYAWQAAVTHDAVSRTIANGVQAMRLGKLAEARIELEDVVLQEPDNPDANLQLGLLLGQLGNVPAAREAFEKAARARPDWPEAHYNLGLTLVADPTGKRDWPAAIAEFREAVRLRPGYGEAHHLLGVGLAETGERQAAMSELRSALAADDASPAAHLDLGKALEASGDHAAAEGEYREALRLRAGYADAEFALGKLLASGEGEKTGLGSEAIEHFNRALRSNPDNVAAQYALAQALQRAGRLEEAAIAFRQAEALTQRTEQAVQCTRLSNEGLDAARRGDNKSAIKLLREAVKLRPDSAVAHYNLALVLADGGDITAGRAQVVEAISLMPLEVRSYILLGRLWKQSGDSLRAGVAFGTAAKLAPGDGAVASELKNLENAIAAAGPLSLPRDGDFSFGAAANTPESHFAFANTLGRRDNWLDAAGEWLRVLALQPDNVDARNNLGVSYAHLGQDDKAELEFRKALQVSPNSAGAHFGLAVLFLQAGKKAEAVRELRAVIGSQPDYPQAQNLLAAAAK
jgi:tetratricopeptide (TPR) repeat protein